MTLNEKYNKARENFSLESYRSLFSELNNLPLLEKNNFLELYNALAEDLFARQIDLPNNKLDEFQSDIRKYELEKEKQETGKQNEVKKIEAIEQNTTVNIEVNYDLYFREYFTRHQKIFEKLKDYFIFKLVQDNNAPSIENIILCDTESIKRPLLKQLCSNESIIPKRSVILDTFIEELNKEQSIPKNYICILCLTPNLHEIEQMEKLESALTSLFNFFNECYSVEVITNKDNELIDYKLSNFPISSINDLLEKSNKVFNNTKLTYQEQRIIKMFYGRHPVAIDYKVLKPGASGSGVVEVQGIQNHINQSKRYVVKIAKIEVGKPKKLSIEKRNFDDYVSLSSSTSYNAEYKENENHEAIRYAYASTDSISDSHSFYELIDDYLKDEMQPTPNLSTTLKNLFNIELMNSWDSPNDERKAIKDIYLSYLSSTTKVYDSIKKILNVNDDELSNLALKIDFENFINKEIVYKSKVCHGDLHTENFFWDNSKIYLIDFGHTGFHHAIVDHTFLEISIRLRHFPNYVSIEEYMSYEEKMNCKESFEEGFDLSFIKRDNIRELYNLIYTIRLDAKKYCFNPNEPLEEYITSLLIISFRLTQYEDLNPLFSLKMAELFLKKLL